MKSTRATPRNQLQSSPGPQPLPLDMETAPDEGRKPLGYRAYIGGILYVEGIIVLLIGLTLLTAYWPPIAAHGEPPNPISRVGLWVSGGALVYMVVIGMCIFFYNLLRPSYSPQPVANEPGAVSRARRYANMKRRTYYIFDDTVCCAEDADDAMHARELY